MLSLLLLASHPAHAWEHLGRMWAEDDFPVTWYMGTEEEDSLPEGYSLEVLQKSFENWHAAECAAISDEYGGTTSLRGRDRSDGIFTIFWNDPDDEIEAGVLGVTYPNQENVIVKETGSMVYRHTTDEDIVFNDNVDFGTTDEINGGSCGGQTAIEAVATHEIGHSWGLEHSCQDGDPCTDSAMQEATMFWSVGECDTHGTDINEDDIASISALYGAYGYFVANTPRTGGSPLSVGFEVISDTPVIGVNWNFGDGTAESTELAPVHEYSAAGQFTVQAEIELEDPTCGVSTYTYDELGYVLACDKPTPESDADGFFTLAHEDGLRWSTVNRTDVSVYGCVDTIAWQVYKGSGEGAISEENLVDLDGDGDGDSLGAWSPDITFPEEGDYVVVMNVGGPGGMSASFLDVTVADTPGEGSGCSTGAGPVGASAAGLLLAIAAGMRRRRAGHTA